VGKEGGHVLSRREVEHEPETVVECEVDPTTVDGPGIKVGDHSTANHEIPAVKWADELDSVFVRLLSGRADFEGVGWKYLHICLRLWVPYNIMDIINWHVL
jgi:hypothetical protein